MKISRRETMQISATALAGLSLAALRPTAAGAQGAPTPDRLVDTQLRNIQSLPLNTDGSAPEYTPQEAGQITGVEATFTQVPYYMRSPWTRTLDTRPGGLTPPAPKAAPSKPGPTNPPLDE